MAVVCCENSAFISIQSYTRNIGNENINVNPLFSLICPCNSVFFFGIEILDYSKYFSTLRVVYVIGIGMKQKVV